VEVLAARVGGGAKDFHYRKSAAARPSILAVGYFFVGFIVA
jgi:hypothetical protein